MKKTFGMIALGMFLLIALTSFSSAAYYGGYYSSNYGAGDYNAYHSFSTKTSGAYYGPRTTTTTNYDRVNEKYWDGYDWVDRTVYVRETRESPQYYSGYYYAPSYSYSRFDNPQRSYFQPNYGYQDNYYPRTSYW